MTVNIPFLFILGHRKCWAAWLYVGNLDKSLCLHRDSNGVKFSMGWGKRRYVRWWPHG